MSLRRDGGSRALAASAADLPSDVPLDSEAARGRLLLCMQLLGTTLLILGSAVRIDADSACIGVTALCAAYLIAAIRMRDGYLLRLACFGTSAGIAELPADAWLVAELGSLAYQPTRLMLWASPAFMPLSWGCMLLSIAFAGRLIARGSTLAWASLAVTIGGCLYFLLFEILACRASWWTYRDDWSIGPVPVFIVLGEALLCLPLAWIGIALARRGWLSACAIDLLQGAWILASYRIGFWLTGGV